MKYTISIKENNITHNITKIVFMRCGGFSVFLPYHYEKKGILAKYKIDYSKSLNYIEAINEHTYTAENLAKLSLHGDGYIQFSSVNGNNIISGKNSDGSAKGLGIKIASLDNLTNSGPICAMTIWGLDDYKNTKIKKDSIELNSHTFEARGYDDNIMDHNGYIIEITQFPLEMKKNIEYVHGKPTLMIKHLNFEKKGKIFFHRIIPYYDNGYILGILISKIRVDFNENSGYTLSGPSEMININEGYTLQAIYPRMESLEDKIDQNLDYE